MLKKFILVMVLVLCLSIGTIFALPAATPPGINLPNATFNSVKVTTNVSIKGTLGNIDSTCSYTCSAGLNQASCVALINSGSLSPATDCTNVLACTGNNNVFEPTEVGTPVNAYTMYRHCVTPVSIANGIKFADGSVRYSSIGSFVGPSSTKVKGNQSGYANAVKACTDAYSTSKGVHVCTSEEMISTIVNFSTRKAYTDQVNTLKEVLWLNNAPAPYSTGTAVGQTNDCKGWTSDSSIVYAGAWVFRDGNNFPTVVPCNQEMKFACCVY
jgi:hypothetical protein